MPEKNVAKGARLYVSFGAIKQGKGTKRKQSEAIARVQESVVKALGLKVSKPRSQSLQLVKDKKGRFYLPRREGTKSATRAIKCTTGDGKWHSVPIPDGISYSRAFLFLTKNSKVVAIHTPAGRLYHKDGYRPYRKPAKNKK
jgi:hypothetical protein